MRTLLVGVAAAVLAACASQEVMDVADKAPVDRDKHLYLEEVEGDEALAWVRAQNARSLAVLENDPRYQGYYDAALAIATSKERIPYGSRRISGLACSPCSPRSPGPTPEERQVP